MHLDNLISHKMTEQTTTENTGAEAQNDASSYVNLQILSNGTSVINVIRYEPDFSTDDSSPEAHEAISTLWSEAREAHGDDLPPKTLRAYMLSRTDRFTEMAPGFILQSVKISTLGGHQGPERKRMGLSGLKQMYRDFRNGRSGSAGLSGA